ncbi:hypothetical protein ACWEKT_33755 [Nocardia takedensis]
MKAIRTGAAVGASSASATMRGMLALPTRVKRKFAGPAIHRDGLELDLDTQLLLRLSNAFPRPRLDPVTSPPRMRAAARRMAAIGLVTSVAVPTSGVIAATPATPASSRLSHVGIPSHSRRNPQAGLNLGSQYVAALTQCIQEYGFVGSTSSGLDSRSRRITEVGLVASVGTVGVGYDDAMIESL